MSQRQGCKAPYHGHRVGVDTPHARGEAMVNPRCTRRTDGRPSHQKFRGSCSRASGSNSLQKFHELKVLATRRGDTPHARGAAMVDQPRTRRTDGRPSHKKVQIRGSCSRASGSNSLQKFHELKVFTPRRSRHTRRCTRRTEGRVDHLAKSSEEVDQGPVARTASQVS